MAGMGIEFRLFEVPKRLCGKLLALLGVWKSSCFSADLILGELTLPCTPGLSDDRCGLLRDGGTGVFAEALRSRIFSGSSANSFCKQSVKGS